MNKNIKTGSGFFQAGKKNTGAYRFILVLFLLVMVNDASADSEPGKSKKEKYSKALSHQSPPKLLKKYIVSGKVSQTFPYCGGASPTKEILERLAIPVAFFNKKFYVRTGKINSVNTKVVASFVTDNSGFFSIQLQPGSYSIILEEQLYKIKEEHYKKPNQRVDIKCLNKWWAKPYYLLKVENKNIVDLKFNFERRCFIDSDIPCIYYTGPPRP